MYMLEALGLSHIPQSQKHYYPVLLSHKFQGTTNIHTYGITSQILLRTTASAIPYLISPGSDSSMTKHLSPENWLVYSRCL